MMKHLASLLLPLLSGTAGALDLTPREGGRKLEGMNVPVLYFTDTTKSIRYQPPGNWNYAGGGDLLTFTPRGVEEADMVWRIVRRKPADVAATPEPPESFAKQAQMLVPPGVEELKMETRPSPFTLNGKGSWEFYFSYSLGGRRFGKSVCLCDLTPTERLYVIISARGSDFAAIRDAGISSLFSWQ